MAEYEIKIVWEGPYKLNEVIETMNDGGSEANAWDGNDYGLYQIYGRHILHEGNTLLYVGITTKQTFSQRFSQHKKWLLEDQDEKDIAIYLGRVYDPLRHSEKDLWGSWEKDIELAEKILIYKYSPNYNNRDLTIPPNLSGNESVCLIHTGKYNRLKPVDKAPGDFH